MWLQYRLISAAGNRISATCWADTATIIGNLLSEGSWTRIREPNKQYLPQAALDVDRWQSGKICGKSSHYPGQKWLWMPSGMYHKFEVSDYCKIIRGRNVLIVGDSLSNQFTSTFISMLWRNKQQLNLTENEFHCAFRGYCPGRISINCLGDAPPFNITFVRNFYLSLCDGINYTLPRYENPWIGRIKDENISIVIMNRGAHNASSSSLVEEMNATLHHLTVHYPTVLFIFRDTPSGHPHCEETLTSEPLQVAKFNYSSLAEHQKGWGWALFEQQNHRVHDLIRAHYPWVIYLNVSFSTALRADSHHLPPTDCLHYCWVGATVGATRIAIR